MKNEKGFTLLELMVTLVILGIVSTIVFPVFTNSNEDINEKLFYSHFETVYQKAVTDAITEGVTVYLEIGENGYTIISPKRNRELSYVERTVLNSTDVGKRIEINQKGKVITPVEVSFDLRGKQFLLRVETGFQNIFFNGTPLTTLKTN